MTARRTLRLSLLAAAAATAFPAAALAHATLERSLPADGARLAAPPASVRLAFDEPVQPAGGSAVVRNDTGASVLAGQPRLERGGRVLVLPLRRRLRPGSYSVRWRVLSDDGHFVSGVLAFGVGGEGAPPRPVLTAAAGNPSAGDVAARWLLFAGLLAAAGAAAFSLAVFRPVLRALDAPAAARAAAARLERSRTAWILVLGAAVFAAGAATLTRHAGWDTRFGASLRAGLIAAAAVVALAAPARLARPLLPAAAAGALALVAVPALGGHALDAGRPWPNAVADVLHVGAAAVWTGGLLALLAVVPAAARALGSAGDELTARCVRRVSALALASVVVLGASGVTRAWFEVGALRHLWDTGYGRALLVKTGLFAVLALVGWLNRYRLLPGERLGGLRRTVTAELVLLAGVVVAVAFLTQLRPGVDAPRAQAAATPQVTPTLVLPPPPPRGALVLGREDGRYAVALAVARRRPLGLTASVLAPTGAAAGGLDVSFRLPGGRTLPARPCGPGCYRAAAAVPLPPSVTVEVDGGPARFSLPPSWAPADRLVRRATRAFAALRSVVYRERLASGPKLRLVTLWRIEAPDRLAYSIRGGPQAVVVGGRRWDRERGGRWQRSSVSPLELPVAPWGTHVADAHVVARRGGSVVVSWLNPDFPAWFTATFDARTALPRSLAMTAAAHFMRHRYLEFNRPLGIRPPG